MTLSVDYSLSCFINFLYWTSKTVQSYGISFFLLLFWFFLSSVYFICISSSPFWNAARLLLRSLLYIFTSLLILSIFKDLKTLYRSNSHKFLSTDYLFLSKSRFLLSTAYSMYKISEIYLKRNMSKTKCLTSVEDYYVLWHLLYQNPWCHPWLLSFTSCIESISKVYLLYLQNIFLLILLYTTDHIWQTLIT